MVTATTRCASRRPLMAKWADYCASKPADVVPFLFVLRIKIIARARRAFLPGNKGKMATLT